MHTTCRFRGVLLALVLLTTAARAEVSPPPVPGSEAAPWNTGVSLTGTLKYGADRDTLDYVRGDAPVAGKIRLGELGTFDNLNPFVAGVKGQLAAHLGAVYETLLAPSLDEPASFYGLLAEAISVAPDRRFVAFRLREQARWHDGTRVTAEDVVFSLEAWRRHSPYAAQLLRKNTAILSPAPREVLIRFDTPVEPHVPIYVGALAVLPRHWWRQDGPRGRPRSTGATQLDPPMGSGPYRIDNVVPGRSLTLRRVENYWGADLLLRRGTHNFRKVQVDYYRDAAVLFEAFKADRVDVRREGDRTLWASGYDFPAVRDGRVLRHEYPVARIGIIHGLVFNQRKPHLKDVRVRRALSTIVSFDDLNREVFYGQMGRPSSFFSGTDLAARLSLGYEEQRLLAEIRATVPSETAAPLAERPHSERGRVSLRRALRLFEEAGYGLVEGRLVDRASGEPFKLTLLAEDAAQERLLAAYGRQLERLGIEVALRVVDPLQYRNRLREGSFDIVPYTWVAGHAPGHELRDYWSSAAASQRGSGNVGGVADPAIDLLVQRVITAPDVDSRRAAGRLLDRILRASHVAVLVGVDDRERIARWNRFGVPARPPEYGGSGFPWIWWWKGEAPLPTRAEAARSPDDAFPSLPPMP